MSVRLVSEFRLVSSRLTGRVGNLFMKSRPLRDSAQRYLLPLSKQTNSLLRSERTIPEIESIISIHVPALNLTYMCKAERLILARKSRTQELYFARHSLRSQLEVDDIHYRCQAPPLYYSNVFHEI